jgi:molybdopterin synthase sulfur carrier subunit
MVMATSVVVTLRYFAAARDAAGIAIEHSDGATVGDLLDGAVARHGGHFADVLSISKVWVNGDPAQRTDRVAEGDEVAVLPPVSGGAQ